MIAFRPIERTDLPLLKKWRNSDEVRPYVREYRLLNDSDQEVWYESYLKSRRKSDFDQEIMIAYSGESIIGVCGFTRIEWRNQRAELTYYRTDNLDVIPLESESSLLNALLNKGFNEFNFHKITWPVYSHDPHLLVYQNTFKTEAILKEEYYWDGKFQDRIYLSITKEEFKNNT